MIKKAYKYFFSFWVILCTLVSIRACVYFLLKLHERDPRIPKWYGDHVKDFDLVPISGNIHAICGLIFIGILLFQLLSVKKASLRPLHRLFGKVSFFNSFLLVFTGIYIGYEIPFGGPFETIISIIFGSIFLFYNFKLFKSAKNKNWNEHKDFVLRMSTLALSVGTLRLGISAFKTTTYFDYVTLFNLIMGGSIFLHWVLAEIAIRLGIFRKSLQ